MSPRRVRFGALVVLLLATAARGQVRPAADQARQLFDEGLKHYNLAEYDQAIESFKAAYRLSEAPLLLYNIAQAYRRKGPGSCEQAALFFQSYLRADPAAADRPNIERRIVELEACAKRESPPLAASRPESVTGRPAVAVPQRRLWPLAAAGAGAAAALAGAVLYGQASAKFGELKTACSPWCPPERWQGWATATNASYALMAAGGAALTAGVALWFLKPHLDGSTSLQLAPAPSGLWATGRF